MPEEELFKTEELQTRDAIADALVDAADQIRTGNVGLEGTTDTQHVTVPDEATFEVELERLTSSETGEQRYELEYEIRWTE
jgi:amphi-Trp domain-containing protein